MAIDDGYTKSLLHLNTGLTDESGKVWAPTGSWGISPAEKKFGSASLWLGVGYATTPNSTDFDFGNGDFTIDWWEKRIGTGGSQAVVARDTSGSYQAFMIGYQEKTLYMSSNKSAWDIANARSMGTVILNKWTHIAVVRGGTTFYTFRDGVQVDTWTSSLALAASTGTPTIGYYTGGITNIYIDELRFSKGIARWTSNFDLPKGQYGVDHLDKKIPLVVNMTRSSVNNCYYC